MIVAALTVKERGIKIVKTASIVNMAKATAHEILAAAKKRQ